MKIKILTTILLLTSCSAKMVVKPGDTSNKYAPINEESRPGIIRYLNEGVASVKKARRDDAYRKMYEICSGKYKIVSEGAANKQQISTNAYSGVVSGNSEYIYIHFECIKE